MTFEYLLKQKVLRDNITVLKYKFNCTIIFTEGLDKWLKMWYNTQER